MIYLTYNDPPSGVFSSQVNDVCNYLNASLNARIRLVAIISIRGFRQNRKKIKREVPDAIVLPALPKANYWQFSCLVFTLLCLLKGEKIVISRNVIATKIALFAKKTGIVKTVCLDGRGAIAAEWNEYEVVADNKMKDSIARWEKSAVLESDYKIAVSQKLVEWWGTAYGYRGDQHVIIPCTLQSTFRLQAATEPEIVALRNKAGFAPDDIILVYSGSASGWQSFSALEKILGNILSENLRYKLLFLSQDDATIDKMKVTYPGQVMNSWLTHSQVLPFLTMCDYGILYRENSVTNQVAAPTKFGEYLSAGLPVMISEGIGDYTGFVKSHHCGIVINEATIPRIEKTEIEKRKEMVHLAGTYFTKAAHLAAYKQLVNTLNKN